LYFVILIQSSRSGFVQVVYNKDEGQYFSNAQSDVIVTIKGRQ